MFACEHAGIIVHYQLSEQANVGEGRAEPRTAYAVLAEGERPTGAKAQRPLAYDSMCSYLYATKIS